MSTYTPQPNSGSPIGRRGRREPIKFTPRTWPRRDQIQLGDLVTSQPEPSQRRDVPGLKTGPLSLDRVDPMYGGLWLGGASAYWVNHRTLTTRQADWLSVRERWTRMSSAEGKTVLTSMRHTPMLIRMIAVLSTWRTCSVEQLSALIGTRSVLPRVPRGRAADELLWAAFATGLIDLGCFPSPAGIDGNMRGLLVRLNKNSTVWDKLIAPSLTLPEWIAATGGLRWENASQYDRHNVLTTELGLRVAEFLAGYPGAPIVNVLGERFTSHALLTHGLPGQDPDGRSPRRPHASASRRPTDHH